MAGSVAGDVAGRTVGDWEFRFTALVRGNSLISTSGGLKMVCSRTNEVAIAVTETIVSTLLLVVNELRTEATAIPSRAPLIPKPPPMNPPPV
jgi:hypothetical protein